MKPFSNLPFLYIVGCYLREHREGRHQTSSRFFTLLVAVAALLIGLSTLPRVVSAQGPVITGAWFPVERETYMASDSKHYDSVGSFDGVGVLYFSAEEKKISFKGFRRIEIPFLGQEANDKYEFRFESFTILSVIPTGGGEYAFQARNDGPFARRVTGKIRVSIYAPLRVSGTVQEFLMEEYGDSYEGVMNRYTLPKSPAALSMLKRYDEIFFGGSWVALDPTK